MKFGKTAPAFNVGGTDLYTKIRPGSAKQRIPAYPLSGEAVKVDGQEVLGRS